MKELVLLLSMIFLHIVDDFYLQGILASLKQKSWWKESYPDKMYRYDYITALILHSFSWTFMVNIPVIVYSYDVINCYLFLALFIINMLIHCVVDNMKANKLMISLTFDQCVHLAQIFLLWLVTIVL